MLEPVSVDRFLGLNLVTDPGELGWEHAVDLLNVDFDERGRMRSRDGFQVWSDAPEASAIEWLSPFYRTSGVPQLIGVTATDIVAYDDDGTEIASQAIAGVVTRVSFARIGTPGSERLYVNTTNAAGTAACYSWDGAAFAAVVPVTSGSGATNAWGRAICATGDGRLAIARMGGAVEGNSPSTLKVSNPNLPSTWNLSNYVEIAPGDGEEIMALCAWREFTFAFKESKFAVLAPPRADASGLPLLVPRMVTGEGLAAWRGFAVSPHGVYFVNRRGIWVTRGGDPVLVSEPIDPVFRGTSVPLFASGLLNQAQIHRCALSWADNQLWFAYPSGDGEANDRTFCFEPVAGTWRLHDFPASALAPFDSGTREELAFTASGAPVSLGVPAGVSGADAPRAAARWLAAGQSRYYKVTATNITGETTPSSEVVVTPDGVVEDSFADVSIGGFLNGRLAEAGGVWATSGAATDFNGDYDYIDGVTPVVQRTVQSQASPRYAIVGENSNADGEVRIGFRMTAFGTGGTALAILRWVDSNNFLYAQAQMGASNLILVARVAGVDNILASVAVGLSTLEPYELRLSVSGDDATASIYQRDTSALVGTVTGTHASLIAPGALQSGRQGFADVAGAIAGANTRQYGPFESTFPALHGVTISWAAVVGATGYRVYRGTVSGGQDRYLAVGAVTTVDDTDAGFILAAPPVTNTALTINNDVCLHGPQYTSDGGNGTTTGAAISSRYHSGLSELGEPTEKIVRRWELEGSGTLEFAVATDFDAAGDASEVALGASIERVAVNRSARGRQIAFTLESEAAFSINSLVAFVRRRARDT